MNILTIDDSATMRMLIKKTLQPDGYTILEADNGQSGLNVAAADKIDLFFVDVNMPVMDGLECVSRLKKDAQYANTPIVFLTTVTDTEKKQMGQSLGVRKKSKWGRASASTAGFKNRLTPINSAN